MTKTTGVPSWLRGYGPSEGEDLPLSGIFGPQRPDRTFGKRERSQARWLVLGSPAPRPRQARCTGWWWDLSTPTLPGQVWGCGGDRRTPIRSLVSRQAPRKFKARLLELRARDAPVAA